MNIIRVLLIFSIFNVFIYADEYKDAFLKLVDVSNMKSTLLMQSRQLADSIDQLSYIASKDQIESIKNIINNISNKMYDDVLEIALNTYKSHFSLDDIRNFVSFYQSDSGAKLAQVAPNIMLDISNKTDDLMKKYIPEIKEEISKILK